MNPAYWMGQAAGLARLAQGHREAAATLDRIGDRDGAASARRFAASLDSRATECRRYAEDDVARMVGEAA